MDEDESKRLKRIIYALVILVLIFMIGMTTWGSIELGKMKRLIASIQIPAAVNGVNGRDGYTPVKGVDYFDGTDGTNGTVGSNGQIGVQGSSGPKGDVGDKGDKGDPGITVLTTPSGCTVLGDTDYQPISECQ